MVKAREASAPFTDVAHLRAGLGRAEQESDEKVDDRGPSGVYN